MADTKQGATAETVRKTVRFAYLPIGARFRAGRAGTVVFQKTDEDHAASLEHPAIDPLNFELSHPCYVVAEASPATEAHAPAVPENDILKRLDEAYHVVDGIHSGRVNMRRSIPACPDKDTDIVVCCAIQDAKTEVASLREKLAQAERKGWNDAIGEVVELLKRIPNRNLAIAGIQALAKGK